MGQVLDRGGAAGRQELVRRPAEVLARPSVWVALAILAVPLGSEASPGGAAVTPADLALLMAVAVAARALLRGETSLLGSHALRCARSIPAAGLLLVAVVGVVAAVLAPNFPESGIGGVRLIELFVLAPFAVMVALRTRTDAVIVLGSLVGLALVEGAIGVWQYVSGTGAGIGEESIRAVGTFGAYNIGSLASLCGLALVACLAVAVVTTGRRRLYAGVCAALLVLPLGASLSRGVYVAAAAAAVVVLSRGRPARLLAALLVGGLLAALIVPPLVASGTGLGDRVASLVETAAEPDQSVRDRLALWTAATQMAVDRPFTGVGPRGFAEHRDAYADLTLLGSSDISFGSDFERVALESPHNLYLLIASEQGLVALLVYVTLFAVLLARCLTIAARPRSDGSTALALVAAGLLTFYLVLFVSSDLGGPGSIFIAFTVGLAARAAADIDLGGRTLSFPSWLRRDRSRADVGPRPAPVLQESPA
jgi:O-antigen ligase